MQTKVCTLCNQEKPVTEFYTKGRQANGNPKYQGKCKVCLLRHDKERIRSNPEKLKAFREYHNEHNRKKEYSKKKYWATHSLNTLICPTCKKEFTQTDGKQKYCSPACRQSVKESVKKYKEKVRSGLHVPVKKGSKLTEKTCKLCGSTRPLDEFSKRPGGRVCDECIPTYYAEMHRKHKVYYKRKHKERELKLKQIEGTHTQAQWEEVKANQDYTCLCCKRREPEIRLTKDHIVPLARGGTDYISNIQGLCLVCNSKKCAKEIDYRHSNP